VPGFVPTPYLSGLLHRVKDRLLLRVNVPLRDVHVAMAGQQVGECPGIHVRRPSRKAGMPERVQFKPGERSHGVAGFVPD